MRSSSLRTALAAALATTVTAACAGAPSRVEDERPVPVEAARLVCPQPTSSAIPQDLPFADREVLNLGGSTFGHRLVYQRTTARRVVLSVGGDPLDALEDLDMNARDMVLGGVQVSLSTTHLQPFLAVVEVTSAHLPDRCGPVFVLAERLSTAELDRVLRTLRLTPQT